jgi:hypothetical protein
VPILNKAHRRCAVQQVYEISNGAISVPILNKAHRRCAVQQVYEIFTDINKKEGSKGNLGFL